MDEFDVVAVTKTIIRSVASFCPGLAAIANAWNEHEALETSRRLEVFREAFIYEVKQNASRFEKHDKDNNSIDQRMQVLERIIEAVRREPGDKKLRAFARMATNAMIFSNTIPQDDKLTLIDAMNTLTETDLATLGKFSNGQTIRVEKLLGETLDSKYLEVIGRLVVSLQKLEARGLLAETSYKGHFDLKSYMSDKNAWYYRWLYKDFEILPLGMTLVELLNKSDDNAASPK